LEQFSNTPTRKQRDATTALLTHINAGFSENGACKITVEQICEHCEQRELRSGDSFRSFATVKTYRGYIRKWIKPRWGSFYLDGIKAVEVEAWLRRLSLGLCPEKKVSGGKVLFTKSRRVRSRVATALRMGAQSLDHAKDYLGEFFRRITRKLGRPQAITATAHKLARIVYSTS
jgi:hypothetical protein